MHIYLTVLAAAPDCKEPDVNKNSKDGTYQPNTINYTHLPGSSTHGFLGVSEGNCTCDKQQIQHHKIQMDWQIFKTYFSFLESRYNVVGERGVQEDNPGTSQTGQRV